MTVIGWLQIVLYCAIIIALTPVLGSYMTRVFNGGRTWLSPVLRPLETLLYRSAGVDRVDIYRAWGRHGAALSRAGFFSTLASEAFGMPAPPGTLVGASGSP